MKGLTDSIKSGLEKINKFEQKHFLIILSLVFILTIVSIVGITKIEIQSDFDKMQPEGLPLTDLNDKTNAKFNQLQSIVIVVQLDDSVDSSKVPKDIRNPQVMEFLVRLNQNLMEEVTIQEVISAGSIFQQTGVPEDINGVNKILSNVPGSESFFNKDYSFTTVIVKADVGGDSKKIKAVNSKVEEIIELSSPPGGVKTIVTGDAPLGATIFDLLIKDAYMTVIFAIILIFILLVIMYRSFKEATIILTPLIFGLSWFLGAMGWLNIPITIGTAGLGAMLLGLGVEYSIFLYSRYKEERQKHDISKSLQISVSNIGSSLLSSGGTTILGFLALSLSIFPILADLGKSLAIGITLLLISTLFFTPIVILLEERLTSLLSKNKVNSKKKIVNKKSKLENIYASYGKFVSEKPYIVLIISILAIVVMFFGIQRIESSDIDFETVLPEDLEAMQAYTLLKDEMGDSSSVSIYIGLNPTDPGTDEPYDLRDPEILRYIDVLTQKAKYVDNVDEVNSISEIVKSYNDNIIPNTITTNRYIFDNPQSMSYLTSDYSVSLIKVTVNEDGRSNRDEIVRQLNEIVDTTEKPSGIETKVIGDLAIELEQDTIISEDSNKTSLLSLLGVILFLYILLRSIKNVLLPLITVVVGVLWTFGAIGYFHVTFNNITSSVVTMIIGIGIDFGLQTIIRYNQELESNDKKKAMELTIANIMTPMVITVVAALIGFRAMSIGELKIMGDLGTTMGIAVTCCMIAALTIVAALIVIFQKENKA